MMHLCVSAGSTRSPRGRSHVVAAMRRRRRLARTTTAADAVVVGCCSSDSRGAAAATADDTDGLFCLAAGLFGFLRRTEISDWLILLVFAEVVLPVPGEVAGGAA